LFSGIFQYIFATFEHPPSKPVPSHALPFLASDGTNSFSDDDEPANVDPQRSHKPTLSLQKGLLMLKDKKELVKLKELVMPSRSDEERLLAFKGPEELTHTACSTFDPVYSLASGQSRDRIARKASFAKISSISSVGMLSRSFVFCITFYLLFVCLFVSRANT
jgi:hypothetical protein